MESVVTSSAASSSTARSRERWRLPPTLLPDGDRRDLWVVDGTFSAASVEPAEVLPGQSAAPGHVWRDHAMGTDHGRAARESALSPGVTSPLAAGPDHEPAPPMRGTE